MNAMILAAGLGTRLKPFTDLHPKALAPVNGRSVLQRNIEWLQQYGVRNVIVNVHHFAEQVTGAVEAARGWGSNVIISDETDKVLETGGGIKKASWFLEATDPSLVMNADILTDLPLDAMLAYHRQHRSLTTLATTNRSTSRYLLFDENNRLCGWKNEKTGELKGRDGNPKAFSGVQVLSAELFKHISLTGKFSMINVYLDLCHDFEILCFDHSDSRFIDIGNTEKLAAAESLFT